VVDASGDATGSEWVSPEGSGDSWLGSAASDGSARGVGFACVFGDVTGEGEGLAGPTRVTFSTVVTQTAGSGLPEAADAATSSAATAPATTSAGFMPPNRRYPVGDWLKRASEGRGVGPSKRSSSALNRASKSGPS